MLSVFICDKFTHMDEGPRIIKFPGASAQIPDTSGDDGEGDVGAGDTLRFEKKNSRGKAQAVDQNIQEMTGIEKNHFRFLMGACFPALTRIKLFFDSLRNPPRTSPAYREFRTQYQHMDRDQLYQMLVDGESLWKTKPTFYAAIGDILLEKIRAMARDGTDDIFT